MRGSSSRRVRRTREDECADWGALWSSAVREPACKIANDPNSPRSQIQALRARLLQQDARIAELRAQALHAKGTINSLKDSVETKKRWHKDDLALAKKYYEDDFARMKRYYDTDLATAERWHKSDMASARTFYNESLQQDRQRALIDSGRHCRTLNAFTNFAGRPPAEATTVEVPTPSLDRILDTTLVITHPLTSARLVGESHLRGCADVLPHVSSFLLRTPLEPLDDAVSRGSVHMMRWLLANGAKPTTLTVHTAVSGGNLDIVKAVFSSIDSVESKSELFQALPINQSEPIAQWLLETFPAQMAKEFVRLSSLTKTPSRCQWAQYAERIKLQWKWEQDFESQCLHRKRKRLEQPPST